MGWALLAVTGGDSERLRWADRLEHGAKPVLGVEREEAQPLEVRGSLWRQLRAHRLLAFLSVLQLGGRQRRPACRREAEHEERRNGGSRKAGKNTVLGGVLQGPGTATYH